MVRRSTQARVATEYVVWRKKESERLSKIMNGLRIPEVEIDRIIAKKFSRPDMDIMNEVMRGKK